MRKIYYLILVALLCICGGSTLKAQTLDPEVVASYFEGYSVTKDYDFIAWTLNDEAMGTLAVSSTAADFKVNNFAVYAATNEGMTDFYFQNAAQTYKRDGYGIYNFGSGGRSISIASLKAGMVIVIEAVQGQTYALNFTAINSDDVDCLTDSIHEAQGEAADAYTYFRMKTDGRLDYSLSRGCYIRSLVILADDSSEEYVTTPTQKLYSVYNETRIIAVGAGESSKGNSVTTWYTTDGTDPIYMVDTENVLRNDTIYATNEDGSYQYDSDSNLVIESITTVYEQVPAINPESDEYGSSTAEIYDHSLGDESAFTISPEEDIDGDGYVTVKVASITAGGVMSEISTMNYEIGEIALNAPTLTLVGMDGAERTYQVGWNNNTLCGESYYMVFEADDDIVTEEGTVGETITAASMIKVTVVVEGYSDGVFETVVLNPGTEYKRKYADNESAGNHDWDFVNVDEEILSKIKGEILDYWYVIDENGDTAKWATEDDIPSEIEVATAKYKDYGWWYDASRSRAWLSVIVDTITDEATGDVTYNAYYVEDKSGLFDGLSISCGPNANNNSCIGLYTNAAGLYLMDRSTLGIEDLVYGEYYIISTNEGIICDECPVGGLTELSLNRYLYIYYIDLYTTEDLPDNINTTESINPILTGNIYSVDGKTVILNSKNIKEDIKTLPNGFYLSNGNKYYVK